MFPKFFNTSFVETVHFLFKGNRKKVFGFFFRVNDFADNEINANLVVQEQENTARVGGFLILTP